MKLVNRNGRAGPPGTQVDWVRAVYLTAVGGAIFWAVLLHFAAKYNGSGVLVASIAAASIAFVLSGLIMRRSTKTSLLQSISIALTVAPVTGLVPLIPLGIVGLIRHGV